MSIQQQWNLPAERVGKVADAELIERRALLIKSAELDGRNLGGAEISIELDVTIGGVPCISCSTPEAKRVIIYFHGGGYRIGAASMWVQFASLLAGAAEARVVLVDYRLAPEHPFPAAIHDAAIVFSELRTEPFPVVAAGDSAGGGLAAALTVASLASGIEPPTGLALLSPWLDLTNSL